jgi:DNA polymerase-3 subunit chi
MNPDLERSACKLIEKIYNSGLSLIVFAEQKIHAESLNKTLWTFASKSFIPHGSLNDQFPEAQPILISDNLQEAIKIKKADILLAYNSSLPIDFTLPERLIYIFHDQNHGSVENARLEYKRLKNDNIELLYYKQQEDGAWAKF